MMHGAEIEGQLLNDGRAVITISINGKEMTTDEAGALAIASAIVMAVQHCQELPGYKKSESAPPLVFNQTTGNMIRFDAPRRGWFGRLIGRLLRR
jgi:hypothetical protein